MKSKICTDLEQSKKLLKLGIDVYTADMYWKNGVSDKYIQCFTPFVSSGTDIDYDYDVPAWSLSALLGILAEQKFKINANGNEFNIDIPIRHSKIWFPSLLDAAFEMVYFLKEEKKI